jgi:hypothetical protein
MSIALHNRVKSLEARIAALEAAFSSLEKPMLPELPPSIFRDELIEKMKNDIQGLKMRMGKKESA